MELKVIGNANFCLDNPKERIVTYRIFGNWSYDVDLCNIKISNGIIDFTISPYKLNQLVSEIRGCDYDKEISILNKYEINFGFNEETTIQELDLIKALFNLFYWLDFNLKEDWITIVAEEEKNYLPRTFDEFIIDYPDKAKEGTLKDIYLIKSEYHSLYKNEIDNLISINLLSEFNVKTKTKDEKNYFIPFTKPVYRTETYKGDKTLELYKKIINDRHVCLTKHFDR